MLINIILCTVFCNRSSVVFGLRKIGPTIELIIYLFLTINPHASLLYVYRKTRDELSHNIFLMLQECNKFREHQARELLIALMEKQIQERENLIKELTTSTLRARVVLGNHQDIDGGKQQQQQQRQIQQDDDSMDIEKADTGVIIGRSVNAEFGTDNSNDDSAIDIDPMNIG